jgi:sporadic carbohydrate cluster 2OG-Fe(II) oxygenase
MDKLDGFFEKGETALSDQFLEHGYVILPVENTAGLDRIRETTAMLASKQLRIPMPAASGSFLDDLADHVSVDKLNDLRLAIIAGLNDQTWLRATYFSLARNALRTLVGNELAMQRRINLSIQLPQDASSLLPVHADVWSGDSPFEVVVWLPLVDCRATKSMYILEPERNAEIQADIANFKDKGAESLYEAIETDVRFLEIAYGNVLVFSQNLLHGNIVNQEPQTRWSMNCRFKSLFSPYADKKLGEFFDPITLRAATRLGLDYQLPRGLDDTEG